MRDGVGEQSLRRYIRAYLELLPERLERIERAIALADTGDATRLMFDLRASSAMLGARRLAELLSTLETTVAVGLPIAPAHLAVLRSEADTVAAALHRLLREQLGLGENGLSKP
jgi:HPt (histidine-containing phosphotransfer) domain-containing protein